MGKVYSVVILDAIPRKPPARSCAPYWRRRWQRP